MEVVETIDKHMAELTKKFDNLKAEVAKAENFVMKGKEQMVAMGGEYQGLEKLKATLIPKETKVENPQDG